MFLLMFLSLKTYLVPGNNLIDVSGISVYQKRVFIDVFYQIETINT